MHDLFSFGQIMLMFACQVSTVSLSGIASLTLHLQALHLLHIESEHVNPSLSPVLHNT